MPTSQHVETCMTLRALPADDEALREFIRGGEGLRIIARRVTRGELDKCVLADALNGLSRQQLVDALQAREFDCVFDRMLDDLPNIRGTRMYPSIASIVMLRAMRTPTWGSVNVSAFIAERRKAPNAGIRERWTECVREVLPGVEHNN